MRKCVIGSIPSGMSQTRIYDIHICKAPVNILSKRECGQDALGTRQPESPNPWQLDWALRDRGRKLDTCTSAVFHVWKMVHFLMTWLTGIL